MSDALDLTSTYIHLEDGGAAVPMVLDAGFWQRLTTEGLPGRLMGAIAADAGESGWEMHPHGEELLLLLEGRAGIALELDRGETVVDLTPEAPLCVVPRGVWHQQRFTRPSRMVFITAGEGTEHR